MVSSISDPGASIGDRLTAIRPGESPSQAIALLLAEVTDRDPTELRPLYEVIDSDALDALLRRAATCGGSVAVQFDYEGYDVRVDTNMVRVRPRDG